MMKPSPSVVLVAFVAWLGIALTGCGSERAGAFDDDVWKNAVGYCMESPRGDMVEDVVKDHLEPGMQISDVRDLLGPPDETLDDTWVYNVDHESDGLLGTCVMLQLDMTDGRLERAEVVRDD